MHKIIQTEDGSSSLESAQFKVTYHSIHGAIQEAQTVFIDAALHYKASSLQNLSILEIGFGTGLNALMTLNETQKHPFIISYAAVEAYPISLEIAQQLNYTQLLQATTLQESFLEMHRCQEELIQLSPSFNFQKKNCLFQDINAIDLYDIIYFDAFAPSAQPELWESPFLAKMYQALKPNGVLTTYCAQGAFKRNLKSLGFQVEGLPGPIGKREMTRALKI